MKQSIQLTASSSMLAAPAPLSPAELAGMEARNHSRRAACRQEMEERAAEWRKRKTAHYLPDLGLLVFTPTTAAALGVVAPDAPVVLLPGAGRSAPPMLLLHGEPHRLVAVPADARPRTVVLSPSMALSFERWAKAHHHTPNERGAIVLELTASGPAETNTGVMRCKSLYVLTLDVPTGPMTDEEFAREHDAYEEEHAATGARLVVRKGAREVFIPAAAVAVLGLYAGCYVDASCDGEWEGQNVGGIAIGYPDERGAALSGDVVLPLDSRSAAELCEVAEDFADHDVVIELAAFHRPSFPGAVYRTPESSYLHARPSGYEIGWRLLVVGPLAPVRVMPAPAPQLLAA